MDILKLIVGSFVLCFVIFLFIAENNADVVSDILGSIKSGFMKIIKKISP